MRNGIFRLRIFNKQHASFNLLDLVPTCILKQNVGPTLAVAWQRRPATLYIRYHIMLGSPV